MSDISPNLSKLLEPAMMEALAALSRALHSAECTYILVGATARMLMLDQYVLGAGSPLIRRTADIDAAVQVAGLGDYRKITSVLQSQGFRPSNAEHRFVYRGVAVDILPYDKTAAEENEFVWPESGMRMSMLGFEEAFASATELSVGSGVQLRVVSVPALVLLKLISYGDRHAPHDLEDVWFCFKYYEDNSEATRRFDCADVLVEGEQLTYEEAGAYLIGLDLQPILTPAAKEVVCAFLAQFHDPYCHAVNSLMSTLNRLDDREEQRREVSRTFRALAEGLGC